MRIFFTTPFSGRQRFQGFIDEILLCLQKSGATVISPESHELYAKSIQDYEARGISPSKAHYTFIANSIAETDVVVIEASQESLRVGHEITLALMYGKPTLVLSQHKNYAQYISNELLTGVKYQTKKALRAQIDAFLKQHQLRTPSQHEQIIQTCEQDIDSLRLTTYATMRQYALQDNGDFSLLAQLAEENQDDAYEQVMRRFGHLPTETTWSVLAAIHKENSPDFVFTGLVQFIIRELKRCKIKKTDHVVDALTHGGAIARLLAQQGYRRLTAVHSSRKMLAKTYDTCADSTSIAIAEASPKNLSLNTPANAIVRMDCTINLALTKRDIRQQLQVAIDALAPGGCLIFDFHTIRSWQTYLFQDKIATFATPNFQHIALMRHNSRTHRMQHDHFVRLKYVNTLWGAWRHEQRMQRAWSVKEIKGIIAKLQSCQLSGVYNNEFVLHEALDDPSKAYVVLIKANTGDS